MKLRIVICSLYLSIFSILCQGQSWHPIGCGIYFTTPGALSSMAVYNGNLYFCENYRLPIPMGSGTYPWGDLAEWNDSACLQPGSGVSGLGVGPIITIQNKLIVGGSALEGPYSSGVIWNDTTYTSLGTNDNPYGFCVFDTVLYAISSAMNLTKWDGATWSSLKNTTANNSPYALCKYNGKLYEAGYFDSINKLPMNHIIAWNDTLPSAVGKGINGYVTALCVYNGKLYAGGNFDSAGGKPAKYLAMWNDTTWEPVSIGITSDTGMVAIEVLYSYNGILYVGGQFDSIGGIPAHNIAMWDGTTWNPMGSGMNGYVTSIMYYDSMIYACGRFDTAGGIQSPSIAAWGNKPLGINESQNIFSIYLYPNPSTGIFTILLPGTFIESSYLEIYNVMGETICKQFIRQTQKVVTINLSGKPNGIYFYRFTDKDGKQYFYGKLIKVN